MNTTSLEFVLLKSGKSSDIFLEEFPRVSFDPLRAKLCRFDVLRVVPPSFAADSVSARLLTNLLKLARNISVSFLRPCNFNEAKRNLFIVKFSTLILRTDSVWESLMRSVLPLE